MLTSSQSSPSATATLFLRLEGPLQSWGGRTIGRFRRTEALPTKSGVIGLLGAALGLSRKDLNDRLEDLNRLKMAVRVDRAGHVEQDYQTVGARIGVLAANGEIKKTAATGEVEPIISPRDYLIDASFLVILHGDATLIGELAQAVKSPRWPLFLGRKRCVPGTRIFAGVVHGLGLEEALERDGPEDDSLLSPDETETVRIITDLIDPEGFAAIGIDDDLETYYERAKSYVTDQLVHIEPPVHGGRIVLDFKMRRPSSTTIRPNLKEACFGEPGPSHPQRANDPQAKKAAREKSNGRCIFCHFEPADPKQLHAHHLTYERRGRERVDPRNWETTAGDDFVMLCEECHAAVTMLEYQNGFGLHRIDPRRPEWHDRLLLAREARRRFADPAYPSISPGPQPRTDRDGELLTLIETTIPIKAGSSFSPDSPGNRWLANRQHIHQRLSMAFPEPGGRFSADGYGVTRDEGGFLFRIEPGPLTRIVVRSRILPDWGRAFKKAGWLVEPKLPRPRLFDLESLIESSEFAFELEANPTKRLRNDGPEGRKGARVPVREIEKLEGWIEDHADKGGFQILDDTLGIIPLGRRTAHMRSAPNRHWDAVQFKGRLRVTNVATFANSLTQGIGPAKAFGFGLLSISRR